MKRMIPSKIAFLAIVSFSHWASYAQTPCSADFPMSGFAAVSGDGISTTTGGAGGNAINIATLSELEAWAASREKNTTPEIVFITEKITSSSGTLITIKNGANISIYGKGSLGELENVGLNIRDYNNVIVRNLKVHEVLYPNDGLTLDNVNHAWVDHCEFYSKNESGIGVDTYDGLLDIKKGARYITLSWNVFHDHKKVLLIGHTDSGGELDKQFKVTIHHNYFYNNDGRNPSLRFGTVHLYNNYFKILYDYGIAVRQEAHALIEGNYYEDVVIPIATDKFDGPAGSACERENVFSNTGPNSITQTACDWWNNSTLSYTYTLDKANNVPDLVIKNAGFCNNNSSPQPTLPLIIPGPTEVSEESVLDDISYFLRSENKEYTLNLNLPNASKIKIDLYNVTGNETSVLHTSLPAGVSQLHFNIDGLNHGLYIYTMEINSKIFHKKLMIE